MPVLDLGTLHRKTRSVKVKEALLMYAFGTGPAMELNIAARRWMGSEKAPERSAVPTVERFLGVDRLLMLVFGNCSIPSRRGPGGLSLFP